MTSSATSSMKLPPVPPLLLSVKNVTSYQVLLHDQGISSFGAGLMEKTPPLM